MPGSPSVPPRPKWAGNTVTWDAIPGVESYRLTTSHSGTNEDGKTECVTGGVDVTRGAAGPMSTPWGREHLRHTNRVHGVTVRPGQR